MNVYIRAIIPYVFVVLGAASTGASATASAAPTPKGSAIKATPANSSPAVKSEAVDKEPELSVAKGFEITVEDYEAQTNTFLLSFVAEPGVGPNYVTPENLRDGIAFPGDLATFMRQKSQMTGSIYQVKKTMPLVGELEMARRRTAKH